MAKAATSDATGNIEYWYCEGCGKYFRDSNAATEITKADTVTAKAANKATENTKGSPGTGDNNNILLYILLMIGGAATASGTALYKRKRK